MGKDSSLTPKGTLTLKDLDSGFKKENLAYGGTATFKTKKGAVSASLALTDASLKDVKSLKDVVGTADWKVPKVKGVTVNSKYDFGTKKYQAGATWDGDLPGKHATTVKLFYGNKDKKVGGEATLGVAKGQKANVTFNQEKILTAKYTLTKGDFTYEPSYNFDKEAPAVAVSKKQGKDNFKLSYDLKSEQAAIEWTRKPLKITASSKVSVQNKSVAKPTIAAVFENTYSF